jgi:pyruvate/2-oxoglutarate dehydrogenase complex dihydrolipoamide acyltransferase (E2) component
MNLPMRSLGVVAAGLLIGTALAPVAAQQQQSGVDGQVALRSDGAVYIIANGQRRWVSTAQITDDELNALPEGEPIYVGLTLAGSAQAAAPAAKPAASAPQAAAPAAPASPQPAAAAKPAASPTATPDPSLSPDLLLEVDIDGEDEVEAGESFRVDVKTRKDVTCELTIKFPDGSETSEDSKNAEGSPSRCRYTVEVPKGMKEGDGTLKGTVREGGKVNSMSIPFRVVEGD